MRYTKIEVTGTPYAPYYYTFNSIHNFSSDLKELGDPLNKTEDGLLFFITGQFYRFIMIPESHPLFNIDIINSRVHAHIDVYGNKNLTHMYEILTESITDKYIKSLFTQEVARSYLNSIDNSKLEG